MEILSWDEVECVEIDEMWSFVRTKEAPRWIWYAIDKATGRILAYVFGEREISGKNEACKDLMALLAPFGITTFYTDGLNTYAENIDEESHVVSKNHTQRIERKNLNLRTRIKRLCRKTICYSKCVIMHDIIIGLVINILEFGLEVRGLFHRFRT